MASGEYRVLTPERVSLQYDIAGIGSRGAAAILDTALQAVALLVVIFALSAAEAASGLLPGGLPGGGDVLDALVLAIFAFAIFAVTNGYFILFEIVWSGQTPGKRLVGVRVMRENGYPLRPIDAVIRNLVRIVDWLPFLYGIGVLTMLLNRRSKRLGDFASGTIVVREGRAPSMPRPTAAEAPAGLVLSSGDATLVRDYLLRRTSMHPTARAELGQRLASALGQRYGLPPEADPEAFLERLAG